MNSLNHSWTKFQAIAMNRFDWCSNFIFLKGDPISFGDRPYLRAVYDTTARRAVLRCSRQVEKTTFICNADVHAAITIPRVRIIVVFPRHEQATVFAKSRLLPVITDSPVVRRILLGAAARTPQVMHMRFANKAEVYIRAAFHSGDPVRGIDGDVLLIDEFQDIASGNLPVLEQALSHSQHRRVILTGTPKSVDNHLEDAFNRSTANEWRVPCGCGELVMLDESCLGPSCPICPQCRVPLDLSRGQWVARNPGSAWGDGFTLNHLATPWLNYPELLEHQQNYNPALFRNECLGLPSQLGDHIVTRAEVEACCEQRRMAKRSADLSVNLRNSLYAGIDWGGGAISQTVLVVGYMKDNDRFMVVFMERFRPQEDQDRVLESVARLCSEFGVRCVAADGGGNGSVYNNLLLNLLPNVGALYAMLYSGSDHQPQQYKGRLWNWTIGRTPSLGMVFTRIKKRLLSFPRLEDSRSFLPEIYCETAEYDEHQRTIKYTHPETQPDDTLHAINYAAVLARHDLNCRRALE